MSGWALILPLLLQGQAAQEREEGRRADVVRVELPRASSEEGKLLLAGARAVEVQENLYQYMRLQARLYVSSERYTTNLRELDFSPERGNRYTYVADPQGSVQERAQELVAPQTEYTVVAPDVYRYPGIESVKSPEEAGCPLTGQAPFGRPLRVGVGRHGNGHMYFVAYAMANLDEDEQWDCWSMASFDRLGADGRVVPYNKPYHEQSDYDERRLEALLRRLFPGEAPGPALLVRVGRAYEAAEGEPTIEAAVPRQAVR